MDGAHTRIACKLTPLAMTACAGGNDPACAMAARGQAAFTCGSKDGRPERAQGPAQCILSILGQGTAQKRVALLESASVMCRPERTSLAPAGARASYTEAWCGGRCASSRRLPPRYSAGDHRFSA